MVFAVKPRAYGAGPAGATEDAGEEEGFFTGRVQPSDVRSCRPDGVGTMEALSVNPLDIRRTAQPTVWTRVFRRNGTQTKCASLRAVLRFRTRHTAGGAGGWARASSGREGNVGAVHFAPSSQKTQGCAVRFQHAQIVLRM